MKAVPLAALLVAAALSAPAFAAPDAFSTATIALGSNIGAAIKAHGMPADVSSLDSGHRWTWEDGPNALRVITDDDGVVRLVDIRRASGTFDAGAAAAAHFTFGTSTGAQAEAALHPIADFAGPGKFPDGVTKAHVQSFRLTPQRELVLLFDDTSATLQEVIYGDRGTVVRVGFLPGAEDQIAKLVYKAPVLRRAGALEAPRSGPAGSAIVRLSLDKAGAITEAAIAYSSGDAALDAAAKAAALKDSFAPAQLAGKAVSAVVYRVEKVAPR